MGIEGEKNDRPKWITTVFRQIVYDIVTNNGNTDATVNLRKAILDLELGKVDPELLEIVIGYPEIQKNMGMQKRLKTKNRISNSKVWLGQGIHPITLHLPSINQTNISYFLCFLQHSQLI